MIDSSGGDDRTGAERGFALVATWSMRWLLIALALWALFKAGSQVTGILVPVAVAILLAALLGPLVRQLRDRGWPRWLAAVTVLLGGLALVGGVLGFVVMSFLAGLPDLLRQLTTVVRSLHEWTVHGPLGLAPERIGWMRQEALGWLQHNRQQLTQGVMSTVFTLGSLLTGALLVVFSLVFFLYEGERMWSRTCGVLPERHRERVAGAGRDVFRSLVAYTRATTVVAIADATGIGVGLFVLGVPLAGPLTALVFLGGFLPILGALVSGIVAVLITLVSKGLITAAVVLAIVVVVQQLEGNVLQPWLVGDAARVHPLIVVLAVTAGGLVAGVVGALLAVPLVITARCVFLAMLGRQESEPEGSEAG
ncbi:putative PurR-regulated permease PerM [Actinopolyspora biskrensis]|uniref:Putative PurR-regulated permease PerM n=1 Tax=Actinopolyspora biskrensis TaxID=1470178 RepID=A0A852ZBG4_9ACTN|nr:AI-2E family transporter [Actinopolyspora biskrensis]NYH80856.1 putative PurR-regulated permease PerM [Actinopolyspora biskrensis]